MGKGVSRERETLPSDPLVAAFLRSLGHSSQNVLLRLSRLPNLYCWLIVDKVCRTKSPGPFRLFLCFDSLSPSISREGCFFSQYIRAQKIELLLMGVREESGESSDA